MSPDRELIDWSSVDGVLFDLDGVITPTADLHRRAWAETFAQYEFTTTDYETYVDGRPRFDGVAHFLSSRGVTLPWGQTDDPPSSNTICALGNSKNQFFLGLLQQGELAPYPDAIALLDHLDGLEITYGLVSSSRNARAVLDSAGLLTRFACIVDGVSAERDQLPGKPSGATYVRGAELIGVTPSRCAVVEDAIAGVQAGLDGRFGLVIGVDRGSNSRALKTAGAHVVLNDLANSIR